MASTKKPNKRGWKRSAAKPSSLMERLAAVAAKPANEHELGAGRSSLAQHVGSASPASRKR